MVKNTSHLKKMGVFWDHVNKFPFCVCVCIRASLYMRALVCMCVCLCVYHTFSFSRHLLCFKTVNFFSTVNSFSYKLHSVSRVPPFHDEKHLFFSTQMLDIKVNLSGVLQKFAKFSSHAIFSSTFLLDDICRALCQYFSHSCHETKFFFSILEWEKEREGKVGRRN